MPKARLAARGFQDENLTKLQTESPVIGRSVIRLLISVAALNNWEIKSFDVKTAFLQSKSIQRRMLIKPPKEAMSKAVWLLRKPVYGLADASKEWFLTAKRVYSHGTATMFCGALPFFTRIPVVTCWER